MKPWRAARNGGLDAEAMPFDDGENRAQRLPIALCLDTSRSMDGQPIARLNEAIRGLAADLRRDLQLSAIAELAIVTFGEGGVTAWRGGTPVAPGTTPFVPAGRLDPPRRPPGAGPFVPAGRCEPPRLRAGGVTPLTAAVQRTIQCVAEEKEQLKR